MADNVNLLDEFQAEGLDVEISNVQQHENQDNVPWWSDNSRSFGEQSEPLMAHDGLSEIVQDGNKPWWAK